MSTPSDERLMQLYDEELGPEEAKELERRIAGDEEARQVLLGLERVGDMLRESADEQAALADDIAIRVMACIDAEEVPSERAPAAVAPLRRPWRHVAPAAGMLALAAAAAFVLWSGAVHHPVSDGAPRASVQAMNPVVAAKRPASVAPTHAKAPPATGGSPPVAIETVDFGSHDGAIFMVSAGRDSTPVVWLTDEPAHSGGRMKPL